MPGEFLAIVGPSGSGKSTLMNILGCLDTPTSGTYLLEGLDIAKLDDDELAEIRATRIGFVFQSFNLLPRMTVLDNVMLPLAYTDVPHGDRERRAVSALRAAGLPVDHYDHRTNELSGGQMQRVAIARALVNDPAIILADEPTGNLDSATGRMVLDTFHALRQQGKTIVLITHDADIAAEADRRITIRDGRLYRDARSAPVVCRPSEAIGCPPDGRGLLPRQDQGRRSAMSIRDLMREAVRALEANRGRTLLTVLGIVIGIAAVIAMTSLIGGVQQTLLSGLGLNAARMVQIGTSSPLKDSDIEKLGKLASSIEFIEGTVSGFGETKVEDRQISISITGTSARMLEMTGQVKLAEGRLFNAQEEASGARVAIIERGGVKTYFGNPDADVIGKQVKINNGTYTIIGVADAATGGMGNDSYMNLIMPAKTVSRGLSWAPQGTYDQAIAFVREGVDVDGAIVEIKDALAKAQRVPEDQVDEYIWVYSMKAQIDALKSFTMAFQLITGAVAGISLLVGGIGIMNMMLTNVTERIREIGVRRALGARGRDITRQFLMESIAICILGGIIGTILGYLLAWGIAIAVTNMGLLETLSSNGGTVSLSPAFSFLTIALAVGISLAIGVLFGFYPARRAAKLDPVECLRFQ